MNLERLKWLRFLSPGIIATILIAPWAWRMGLGVSVGDKWIFGAIVPAFGLVVSFLYEGFEVRDHLWLKEQSRYVGTQIRAAILALLPPTLQLTEGERRHLEEKAIWRKLSGVFWEAVDEDPKIAAHKTHFYSNGFFYSTSFDIVLLGLIGAFIYLMTFVSERDVFYLLFCGICLVLSFLGWRVFVPRFRERHLELSAEQLEMLKERQAKFIAAKMSDIVYRMRTEAIPHEDPESR